MILREDVLSEIAIELDELFQDAPEGLSELARTEIRDEAVGYLSRVLDALTTRELQNEAAFERFIVTTVAQARMRMHQR